MMGEPASFADLTSEKGWAEVGYQRTLWIPCLAAMPDGYDTDRWAREFSAAWWSMAGLPHGDDELARLEAQLAYIRDNSFGHLPFHMGFIHLPDPRLEPLPVFLAILAARGERTAQLRALTLADAPNAVGEPIVEEFATERLGPGLRVLRHFTEPEAGGVDVLGLLTEEETAEVNVGLSYAWRSEEHETDLRLFTATHDWGRLRAALGDIDELARQIRVIPFT